MNNLTSKQYQILENCFIPRELADEAKYTDFGDIEMAERLSRTPKAGVDLSCFGKPIFSPFDLKNPREWVYRLNNPEKDKQPDGTIKEKNKYLRPKGAKNMLDFQPNVTPEMLDDVNLDILYCETSKGMLACYRLSQLAKKDWLSIGQTGGCWGFRGKVEKAADENGVKHDISGVIPDVNQISWQGRKVTIIYDADAKSNPKVKNAQSTLAKTLQGFGAVVYIVDLPEIEATASIDDLLAFWERQHGLEKAIEMGCQLIESAKLFEAETGRKSIVEKLIDLSEDLEFFHTANLDSYAIIKVNSHFENIKLHSKEFRAYISRLCWVKEGKAISGQSLQDVINVLHSKALYDSPQTETHIRYASHENDIYIDSGNDTWQAFKISGDGFQIIESKDVPVRFRRTRGMLPLPMPEESENSDSYKELSKFINVKEEDFILICAWIISAMRPDFACPVLILYGGQGTGKSTTTEYLRGLIDPNISALRSKPRDERDLMIAARNGWVLSFDNLSQVAHDFSDSLCRIVTGGGLSTRELYSDDSEVIFDAKRPMILNGISELANRSDLIERSIPITLPVIGEAERKDEKTFQAELLKIKPKLFGAFLNKLSEALRKVDSINLETLPRMADFAKFGYAAFGKDFINQYATNRGEANETALENSPIAETLIKFLSSSDRWEGTSSELLTELENKATERTKNAKGFPKQAKPLSEMLKRIEPNLLAVGWTITRNRTGKQRTILFSKIKPEKVNNPASSASSASSANVNDSGFNDLSNDAASDAQNRNDARVTHGSDFMTHDDAPENVLRHCVNNGKSNTYNTNNGKSDADDAGFHPLSNGKDNYYQADGEGAITI